MENKKTIKFKLKKKSIDDTDDIDDVDDTEEVSTIIDEVITITGGADDSAEEEDVDDDDTDTDDEVETEIEEEEDPDYIKDRPISEINESLVVNIKDKSKDDNYHLILNERNKPFSEIGNKPLVKVEKGERRTQPYLTKYEKAKVLGFRKAQISQGAKVLIKNHEGMTFDKIARKELLDNLLSITIRRLMPNRKYEEWSLKELDKTVY